MRLRLAALVNQGLSAIRPYLPGQDMRRIGGQTFGLLVMQLSGFVLLFGNGMILGRWLGAAQFGAYTTVVTIVGFAKVVACLGLPSMVIRRTAAMTAAGDWPALKGLLHFSRIGVLAVGLAAMAVVWGLGSAGWLGPAVQFDTLLIALPLILVIAFSDSRNSVLVGLDRPIEGRFSEFVARPGLLLVFLFGFALVTRGVPDTDEAMALRLLAELLALGIGFVLLLRALPKGLSGAKPKTETTVWIKSLGYYLTIDIFYLVFLQIDILFLAAMRPIDVVGIYRMAMSLVLVTSVASIAGGFVLASRVSAAWTKGEHHQMQSTIVGITRLTFLGTLGLFLAVLAAIPLIEWLLGPSYRGLFWPTFVLGIGNVVRSFFSGAPNLTLVTGGERAAAIGIISCALLNVALNLLLIPLLGMMGAAVASTIASIALTLMYTVVGHRRTGLDSSALGWWGPKATAPVLRQD